MSFPLNKRFLRAFTEPTQTPPPIWLMRQAGRYLPEYKKLRARVADFQELCHTPELAVEVTLQPIRRFDFDAAIIFSDILLLPAALGQTLHFKDGQTPRLQPALRQAKDLSLLHDKGLLDALAPTLEALALAKTKLPAHTSLIGFAGAPWTVATYMTQGQAEAKLFHYRDPDSFAMLLDILTDATITYLTAQVEAGAETVQLFESWAGDLPEDVFRRCSLQPIARIAKALRQKFPSLPILLFSKGSGVLQKLYATETDVSGISIDSATPCSWARDEIQPHKLVQGNLDPYLLLAGGAQMERQIDNIIEQLSGGAFIFNLGHGILPTTPIEHVERLVERVRASR